MAVHRGPIIIGTLTCSFTVLLHLTNEVVVKETSTIYQLKMCLMYRSNSPLKTRLVAVPTKVPIPPVKK